MLVDRCKDVIIVKGCNVSSIELEKICQRVFKVNCIVVSEINEKYGELPVCIIESEDKCQ